MQEARRAPKLVRAEARPLPPTPEGDFAQLVKTVATLITLDAYRGLSTVRALAARHSVSEAEVLRAHRRAVQSVGDARGGLRAQLELSVATLSRIRDEERKVAQDYTGIAERIVAPYLPNAQTGAALARAVPQEDLDRAKTARSIASQAQDTAISDVEIIWMLMPSLERTPNIREATPEWLRIPTPTMETLATRSSWTTPCASIVRATSSRAATARV
jgi:hypothetical protein